MATWNNERVRDLVIRTIVGEALDNRDSMVSVAHVLKNRADSGQYGDRTVNGLSNTITANNGKRHQFSMWDNDIRSDGKTILPSDPRYERAGNIADAVFSGQIPDNTGGADHYYAPGGMVPTGRAPSWAIGQTPTATIGGQHFYKLGLSAGDATNQGHTSAPAISTSTSSPTSGQFGPNDVYRNIPVRGEHGEDQIPMFLRWNPDPIGNDQKNFAGLNPNLQRIIAQARTDNPNLSFVIGNGRRSAADQDWAKSVGWSKVGSKDGGDASTHMNGDAVDLWGLDKNGRVQMDPAQQAQINQAMKAAAAKLGVPITWGGDWKGSKDAPHFELPGGGPAVAAGAEGPKYVAPLLPKSAVPMGEGGGPTPYGIVREAPATPSGQGGIGSDAKVPLGTAPPGTSPAVSTIVPNPDVPAANSQPVAASGPPGSGNPSAGFVGPGSDKYSVISSMTTGTSHNPQLTTAANWGNLFGGGNPSTAPPAPAPAAATPQAPQPGKPLDTSYGPQLPPVMVPPGAPVNEKPGSTMSSVLPNWGADKPNDPWSAPEGVHPWMMPASGVNGEPAMTEGTPSMGFPAMTNPFGAQPAPPAPPTQTAQLPGSMFASAQNLLKLLFPTA